MEWNGKEKWNAQQSKYGMHNLDREITVNEQLSADSIPLILLYSGTISKIGWIRPWRFTWNLVRALDIAISLQVLEVPVRGYPLCPCCEDSQSENTRTEKFSCKAQYLHVVKQTLKRLQSSTQEVAKSTKSLK